MVQLRVKVSDIFEEIANFNSNQLVPIAIGTNKVRERGTLGYPRRITSLRNKNYTWGCGEVALCNAKVAIFSTSVGDKSQNLGDKSQQPFSNDNM